MRSVCSWGLGTPEFLPPFALIGIAHNGQSLCTGNEGFPVLTTSQPFANVQLFDSSGNYTNPDSGTWSTIPLVAPIRANKYGGGGAPSTEYPINIGGETAEVTCANVLTLLSSVAGWRALAHNTGQGGAGYSVIGPGGSGNAYQALLNEIEVATGLGIGYGVGFALLTHGEADASDPVGEYLDDLVTYQQTFQANAQAMTGQTGAIPLILSQQNAYPVATGSASVQNLSALAQLLACQSHPSDIIFACPKYAFPYYENNGHLTNVGYRMLGEKYGQVAWLVLSKIGWTPFFPLTATRYGNVVTVTFQVPVAPLLFSSAFTAPHLLGTYASWAAGLGFGAWSGGVAGTIVGIDSVAIVAPNQVVLTCASPPDTIEYAHTPDATSGETGGFPSGRCGLLTDSDPFVGPYSGQALPNWCPEFVMPVT